MFLLLLLPSLSLTLSLPIKNQAEIDAVMEEEIATCSGFGASCADVERGRERREDAPGEPIPPDDPDNMPVGDLLERAYNGKNICHFFNLF